MKLFSVLLVTVSLVAVSCERHEFDGPNGTKQLNEAHGAAAGHDAAGGHDTHHGEDTEHSEKKAGH